MTVLIVTGLLVLARVGALMSVLPIFSLIGVPRWVTGLVALVTAGIIAAGLPPAALSADPGLVALAMMGEIVLGAIMGLGVAASFASLALAAEIMSAQMGLSFATMFDPINRAQETVLGTTASFLAGLVFVTLGLHGQALEVVAASFHTIPPGGSLPPSSIVANQALEAVSSCLAFGVQLSGPVVALVWLVYVFVALLSKLAPRMQAFFSVGITTTGIVGMAMFMVSLPWLLTVHGYQMAEAVSTMVTRLVGA